MGPKTLPTICGTYMKLVTKYQISAIKILAAAPLRVMASRYNPCE